MTPVTRGSSNGLHSPRDLDVPGVPEYLPTCLPRYYVGRLLGTYRNVPWTEASKSYLLGIHVLQDRSTVLAGGLAHVNAHEVDTCPVHHLRDEDTARQHTGH